MINIRNLNKLLKINGLQEFPLNFAKKLKNKNLNNIDKTEIINVLKTVNNGQNPLMYILYCNKYDELRFKSNDIMDLINLYPKQLLQVDINDWNPLLYLLRCNKEQELGLTREDILNIINLYPEQLLQFDKHGYNPLISILAYNKTQELNLPMNFINTIYEQQIDKKYNYSDLNNKKRITLFNASYILNKLNLLNCDTRFFQEFLDYRKALLEKQKITNVLKVKQENKTCINFKI